MPDSVVHIDGTGLGKPTFYKCHKLSKVFASDTWKRVHGDLLQMILPIQQEDIQWCTEAAAQGSEDDMLKLIHGYQTNQGSSGNAERLKKWTAKEKFVSWNDSMFAQGNRYYWTSEEKDRTRGVDRHIALAKQGDVYAQLWIGECYFWSYGVLQKRVTAVPWFRKAAEKGYANAKCWTGICDFGG